MAQFRNELAAVQQTSGTLCLRNRNLGDRGLQDASPALQENELATVSKKTPTKRSSAWHLGRVPPAAGAPSLRVPPGVRRCPGRRAQRRFLLGKNKLNIEKTVKKPNVILDNNSLPPAPLLSKPPFPELRCQA